jgi:hypothetical protein
MILFLRGRDGDGVLDALSSQPLVFKQRAKSFKASRQTDCQMDKHSS